VTGSNGKQVSVSSDGKTVNVGGLQVKTK
jgi:hypothetical protein